MSFQSWLFCACCHISSHRLKVVRTKLFRSNTITSNALLTLPPLALRTASTSIVPDDPPRGLGARGLLPGDGFVACGEREGLGVACDWEEDAPFKCCVIGGATMLDIVPSG